MNTHDDKLKIMVLIPARGGSKRLPDKNILPLGGKSLISWTIDFAKRTFPVSDIIISTDSESIAEAARALGVIVPWLRPALLATDTASTVDVAIHALDWYEQHSGAVDALVLLQPTSPFRPDDTIPKVIKQFINNGGLPVVSVSPAATHPLWAFKVENGKMCSYVGSEGLGRRSQDLPAAYALNGSIYMIAPNDLRHHRSFILDATEAFVMEEPLYALDIDTAFDFAFAEMMVARNPCVGKS